MIGSGTVFDGFTSSQQDDVSKDPHPSWGPTSRRSTFSTGNGSSTIAISNIGWNADTGTIPGSDSGISYKYLVAQNFRSLQQIVMDGSRSSSLRLSMSDGTRSQSLAPNSATSTSATWNLSSFTNIDKSHITSISFTLTNVNGVRIKDLFARLSSIVNTIETPIKDDFINPQGPTNTSNTNQFIVGISAWMPQTSARRIATSSTSFSTDINRTVSRAWHSVIPATGSVTLSYQSVSTFFNLIPSQSTLESIINITISTNAAIGSLRLTLVDSLNRNESITKGIKVGSKTIEIPLTDFNNVILSSIAQITFTITNLSFTAGTFDAFNLFSFVPFVPPICVAKNTKILMADGTEKPIQNIKRGDIVTGADNAKYQVARLIEDKLPPNTSVKLVTIKPNAIAKKQPHTRLVITSGHPVLYNGDRYIAKNFGKFHDVKYHKNAVASKFLPANKDGTHSLFNIQFEHDGYYIANGLTVDSVPVLSHIRPLPKELFFHPELYNKPSKVRVAPLKKKMHLLDSTSKKNIPKKIDF